MNDLETIGVHAIMEAVRSSNVIAIDEVGPMELFSEKFKDAVNRAVGSGKLVIGVVHRNARDKLIDGLKRLEETKLFDVTLSNRESLHGTIAKEALKFLDTTRVS
jgi:nucleoside-triphosphatase